ncbi:hypothetical protein [Hymenobacter rubidus]|uniref:hypothetical protein n=1 Tax=Hymenobacter rubidus TaxID=1441626 RepID=UPI00191FFD40|nr:hypothetical protein [Hymenobacter rubidus]
MNLTDFSIEEDNGRYVVAHNALDRGFYFSIKVNSSSPDITVALNPFANILTKVHGTFSVEMSPGQIASVETSHYREWEALSDSFDTWLQWVKEEIDTPDLWAEAAKTAQLFAYTAEPSDDKFTRTELAEVQGQLRQLQLSFTQSALPEEAKQKLIELTQTAAVKAEGLTKKDWQNWIIGGFISAITGLLLNPTQAGEVLKLVKAAFGGLFLH